MRLKRIVFYLLVGGLLSCQNEANKPLAPFAWGFSLDGFPITKSQLAELEQETKIIAQIIQFYLQWPAINAKFVSITSSLEAIENTGAIPCMTWEPMITLDDGKEETIPYEVILKGKYDDYLNNMANEIKKWNKPIIIRLAQEMNLKRYHWGSDERGYGPQSPEVYIKIFRYVVDVFHQNQVKNVLWAFCPNVDSIPNASWNQVKKYYPGDQYIDLLGMDGYNWAISQEMMNEGKSTWVKPWLSFEELFGKLYQELKSLADKPVIVFETASVNRNQKKGLWIKEALKTAKNWNLAAVIWFQVQKEEDWRMQQDNDYSYVPAVRTASSVFDDWIFKKFEAKSL